MVGARSLFVVILYWGADSPVSRIINLCHLLLFPCLRKVSIRGHCSLSVITSFIVCQSVTIFSLPLKGIGLIIVSLISSCIRKRA